jgi:hypothetical protein
MQIPSFASSPHLITYSRRLKAFKGQTQNSLNLFNSPQQTAVFPQLCTNYLSTKKNVPPFSLPLWHFYRNSFCTLDFVSITLSQRSVESEKKTRHKTYNFVDILLQIQIA